MIRSPVPPEGGRASDAAVAAVLAGATAPYKRNYGGTEDPDLVEMVATAPHRHTRRDVAGRLGLRVIED